MKRLLLLLCLLPLIFSVPDTSSAVGGIITDGDKHMRLMALDVRYIVDREARTITAEIQQIVRGSSEHYVWLFPVPDDNPIVELDGGGFRSPFRSVNLPSFQVPLNPCGDVYNYSPSYGSGGDDSSPIIAIETNDQVIDGENITQWLNDNNFTYQPEQLNIIEDYAGQGMSFLAVEYTINVIEGEDDNIVYFFPVRITYDADALVFPLRLTGFSAGPTYNFLPTTSPYGYQLSIFAPYVDNRILPDYDRVPIRITIEGDGRYLPTTFPNISMDYSRLRASHAVGHWEAQYDLYQVNRLDYLRNRSEILRELNGQAFFTDYAGIRQEDAPYTTELYAEIPSTSMTQDIHFVYTPDAPDTPTEIDLSEYVDPLDFWGCSTRTLRSNGELFELGVAVDYDDIEKDLPDGFSWMIRDPIWTTGLATRHPEGWIYSELEFPTVRGLVRAYSPEKVTLEMILDYFNGEDTPPMLLYIPTVTVNFGYFPELPFDAVSIEQNQPIRLMRRWLYPQGTGFAEWIILLTGEEDFYQNRAIYEAMVDYRFYVPLFTAS